MTTHSNLPASAALPDYECSSIEERSREWHVRIAVGLVCSFCDLVLRACDAEQSDRTGHRLRFVCRGCHRDLINVEHEDRSRD
jgi:hypothetical protein